MWQVNIGNSILYYPGSEDAAIYDTNLNEECGLAGEFSFKVPPTNPQYPALINAALVTVLRDKKEYWRGEISDIKVDFAKVAEVYCIEDLAWLGDEFLAPELITNQTFSQRFQAVISSYNTNRSADRQFTAGNISNRSGSATCRWATEYEWSILDSLRNIICGDDGYVKVRRVTSNGTVTRYIDIADLPHYGTTALQPIEYGYNLLDYVKDSDYGNLTNVLTPYGDPLENPPGTPVYVYGEYAKRLEGTTISDSTSISLYGRHKKAVVFNGASDATTLNNLASAYLSRYKQPQLTMEVSAVDLAEVGEADAINIGDSVRIIAKPFGVDQELYLTQIQRDIQNLDRNKITLSGHVVRHTLTSQIGAVTEAMEALPAEILESARKNALSLLLDETQGGYVVYEYDSTNKYVVAINICNQPTIEASTKRWRWAQNGIGYMSRSSTSAEWSNMGVAMTINGEVIGDFFTAGMIKLTGASNQSSSKTSPAANSFLKVYNGSNEVGHWGSDGIWVGKGAIDLGPLISNEGTFHVDNNGYMKLRSGFIQIGTKSNNRYPFYVSDAGILQATGADISGAITATSGSFTGEIKATSGKIGSDSTEGNRWVIGTKSIYNGCTGADADKEGTYVGTDGIRNQSGTGNNKKYTQIKNGKVTSNDADITGSIKATGGYFQSGYFGTNGNWEITTQGLHTKNGPTAPYGQNTKGVYVGADGVCVNGDSSHVWISGGALSTNGGLSAKGVTVLDGGDLIIHGDTKVVKSGSTYTGASGTIAWVDSLGNAHGLGVQNGIVTYIN